MRHTAKKCDQYSDAGECRYDVEGYCGYSQQVVDALTKERDELKAERNKYIQVMMDAGKSLETEKGLHLHDVLILAEKFAVTKKELDELKAEVARRKRYCGFLLCCAKCGEIPKSYEWFCNKEKDD